MTDAVATIGTWHDFFVASSGATAVLLGLTFVGLTLHLERSSLDGTRRGLAAASGTSLVYAFLASLIMLIPQGEPYAHGVLTGVIGLLGVLSSTYALRQIQRDPQRGLGSVAVVLQFGVPVLANGLLLAAGVALGLGWAPAVWVVGGVVFVLLIDGIQSAWDLLRIGFI
jgi:hypothetical protein